MRLQDQNDYTTLTWVKPEIDETLKLARQGLEDYVENGQDPAQLELCANGLAQVHGALRMVELYGAAMVAEEMHALAKALIAGGIEDRDNAFSALMRGIMQLPDYLERLQTGFRDIPLVLLPLLNDLRGARGEKGVSEAMLFSPNLGVELPASARGPGTPLPLDQVKRRAEVASQLFQGSLLKWLKDGDRASARDLADVCLQMVEFTSAESARRLFWVASSLLDAAARGAFPVERAHQQVIARIEREIKRLATEGDAAFRTQPPLELTRQLLYFIAHAPEKSGRLGEVNTAFALESYMPSEREVEHARSAMAGHNRALLSTVTNAIKEDLLRVKDALDLHMRAPAGVVAEIGGQIETLDRVKETLGVLGLGVPQRVVRDQLATMHAIAGGHRAPDESALLDIAGALLYVEAMLDDQVARLGDAEADGSAPQPLLPAAEARAVLDVVAREALNNFSNARACFVAFVETHWDHTRLQDVAPLLSEVAGALRILEVPAAVDLLTAISRFTVEELAGKRRVPTGHQLDRLADALASLEYFLEAVRDRRPNPDQILNIARDSLAAIGYWPLPAVVAPAPVAAPPEAIAAADEPATTETVKASVVPVDPALVAAIDAPAPESVAPVAPVAAVDALPSAPAASTPEAPVPATAARPAGPVVGERLPGYDAASNEDVDAEIQEVFLEEFSEEIDNLANLLPAWGAKLDNVDALRPIRRVFHTLKGSGRLVGAKTLGEFSWKIENMLNRVLDGTRPPTSAVYDIVAESARVLPDLRAALAGEERYADLEGLKAIADRVAAGEDAHYVAPAAHDPEPGPAVVEAIDASTGDDRPAATEPPPLPELPPFQVPAPTASAWPMLPAFEAVPEAVSFALDPVLLEILRPEVEGHLEVVEEWLSRSEALGPQRVEERLLRSVHTMNGAFAMTEVSAITGVTSPLEGLLKRIIAAQKLPCADDVVLARQATFAVRQTLEALAEAEARLPQFPALAAALLAARDALPEPGAPVISLGEEDTILAVDMGGIDTGELPRFEADDAVAPEPLLPADAEDPERLTLDSFLDAPLPAQFDIAGADEVRDGTLAVAEAPSMAPALPPADERAEEAAYAAQRRVLQVLAEAEAADAARIASESAARRQAEREAQAASEAAMALAIAEAAAAEAAAAEAAAAEAAAAEAAAAEAAAAEAAAAEAAAAE
ncbi:Hpt domain-containing protein, partial [Silanimonas algicola]